MNRVNENGELTRIEHRALALATLEAISRLDVDAALSGLHAELVFELPYEKTMAPLSRDGFAQLLRGLDRNFQRFTMTVLETVESVDPAVLVLRYRGDGLSKDGTVSYRNDYLGMLYFADGLIRHWREYANPVISRRMNERLGAVATQ